MQIKIYFSRESPQTLKHIYITPCLGLKVAMSLKIRGARRVTLPFQKLTLYTLKAFGNQHPVSGNGLTAQNERR